MESAVASVSSAKPRRTFLQWLFYGLKLVGFFIMTLYLALGIMIGLRGAYQVAHPARGAPCCLTPLEYAGYEYEDVTFPARDGVPIAAWYIPSQNGAAVVLSHSFSVNRVISMPVAVMLAEQGYGALLIDLRGHGESGGDTFSLWKAGDDMLGAVDYLQTRPDVDPDRIGVWGFSAGAHASVHAAARSDQIKAVAADGLSWSRFKDTIGVYRPATLQFLVMDFVQFTAIDLFYAAGAQPRALLDDVPLIAPRPLLIFAAGDNPFGNEALSAAQYQQVGGEAVSVWVVPDAVHGGGWDFHREEYRQRLLALFDAALGE